MALPEITTQVQLPSNVAVSRILQEPENLVIPANKPRLFSQQVDAPSTMYAQETLGDQPFQISQINIDSMNGVQNTSMGTGVVVLPIEGGGRGPTIKGETTLTAAMLLNILIGSIDEEQFTPNLNIRLDTFENDLAFDHQRIDEMWPNVISNSTNVYLHGLAINDLENLTNDQNTILDRITPLVDEHSAYWTQYTPIINQNNTDIATLTDSVYSVNNRLDTQATTIAVNTQEIADVDTALMTLANFVNANSSAAENTEIALLAQQNALDTAVDQIIGMQTAMGLAGEATDTTQEGYATHQETILLHNLWEKNKPTIDLNYSHGTTFVSSGAAVDQEVLYGYEGLMETALEDEYQFTVNAAILEKAAPTVIALAWEPDVIAGLGPDNTETATDLSSVTTTTADCMGLRIKGIVGLNDTVIGGVSGRMYAQMAIDTPTGVDPVWITISEIYVLFNNIGPDWVESRFDKQFVFPQGEHTYQFRGLFVMDYAPVTNAELNAAITILSVTESGTGAILSNDLQIKWSAKD